MTKISVIVPVFNTLPYLEKCVLSLVNQTIKDIEIILVDDGSTDGSSSLCDELKLKYKNIVVIHKKNGGLSSARNEGIIASTGDYIGFVDSDDYVEPDMYEKLFGLLKNGKNDSIACSNFRKVFDNGKTEERHTLFNSIVEQTKEDYFKDLLLHKGDVSVCTKLFPRSLIKNHYFENNKLNEDLLYIFNLSFVKIIFLGLVKYNYFVRGNSITNTFSNAFAIMGENSIIIREQVLRDYPPLVEVANRFAIVQNLYLVLKFPKKKRKNNEVFSNAITYLRTHYKEGLTNIYITKKEKTYLKGIKYFPNIFLFIYHIFR